MFVIVLMLVLRIYFFFVIVRGIGNGDFSFQKVVPFLGGTTDYRSAGGADGAKAYVG